MVVNALSGSDSARAGGETRRLEARDHARARPSVRIRPGAPQDRSAGSPQRVGTAHRDRHGVPSGAVYAGGQLAGSPISKKPCYLVTLDGVGKGGKTIVLRFVAVDKPDFNTASFAQVKGFYCDSSEEEIVSSFQDIIRLAPKESIILRCNKQDGALR